MAVRRTASALPSPVARFGLWRPGVPGATEASGSCRRPLPGPAPARCAAGRDRVVWFGPVGPFYARCSRFSSYRGVLSEGLSGERPRGNRCGQAELSGTGCSRPGETGLCALGTGIGQGVWVVGLRQTSSGVVDAESVQVTPVLSGKLRHFRGGLGHFPAPPRYKCPSMSRIDPVFRTPDQSLPLRRQG